MAEVVFAVEINVGTPYGREANAVRQISDASLCDVSPKCLAFRLIPQRVVTILCSRWLA